MRVAVVGSGIAGMLAAKACSRWADSVTILERDRYPEGGVQQRAGARGARHAHFLKPGGQGAIEEICPGFTSEAVRLGGQAITMKELRLFTDPFGWLPRIDHGTPVLLGHKDLFEHAIRTLCSEDAKIRFESETVVSAIKMAGDEERAVGVVAKTKAGNAIEIDAEIVVDASGATTRSFEWLTTSDNAPVSSPPPTETFDAGGRYATLLLENEQRAPMVIRADRSHHAEHHLRAMLLKVDARHWMLTISTIGGRNLPTDVEGFLSLVSKLGLEELSSFCRESAPSGKVHGFVIAPSVRRNYETWDRLPEGFVAIGDSVMFTDPVYGNGIPAAAFSAVILQKTGPSLKSRNYFRDVRRALTPMWLASHTSDFSYSSTTGQPPPLPARFIARTIEKLRGGAFTDPTSAKTLLDCLLLLKPMTAFFAPHMIWSTVRSSLSSRTR